MTTNFSVTADTAEEMREAVVSFFDGEMTRHKHSQMSMPPRTKKEEAIANVQFRMIMNNRDFFRDLTIKSSAIGDQDANPR